MTHSPRDLLQLNRERFLTAYQQTFNPLYQIAQNMGYVHKSEHAHPLIFAADADWKTIQDMFDKEHKWMTGQMQKHIREVNEMFYDVRKMVQERYKEYDGTYLGHYVQYFFWFFCIIGIVIFGLTIFLLLDSHYHRT